MGFIDNDHPLLLAIQTDVGYTEEHIHNRVRWYGKKAVQDATHWAVLFDTGLSLLYRAISGAGVYGADTNDEAQVFGTDDTLEPGYVKGDFDQILVVANSSATVYLCRIIWGTGTMAAAITAKQYSEFPYLRGNADNNRKIQDIKTPLVGIHDKIWLQCMNATDNATLDFIVGVHGYPF
jgi:hypothetical protein